MTRASNVPGHASGAVALGCKKAPLDSGASTHSGTSNFFFLLNSSSTSLCGAGRRFLDGIRNRAPDVRRENRRGLGRVSSGDDDAEGLRWRYFLTILLHSVLTFIDCHLLLGPYGKHQTCQGGRLAQVVASQ